MKTIIGLLVMKGLVTPLLCHIIIEQVTNKIYFIIDQQIARHFVQYSQTLSNPPSLLSM